MNKHVKVRKKDIQWKISKVWYIIKPNKLEIAEKINRLKHKQIDCINQVE